ncbi:MAG: rod shape-determining protein MreD [Egibacteraceae bacterium]
MVTRVAVMAVVTMAALLLQTVVMPACAVFGWRPDLITLTVIGFALADGPQTGVRYGFAAGLVRDLASGGGRLALSSLVLLLVGWMTGQSRRYLTGSPIGGQMAVGGIASAAALLLQGLLGALLGVGQQGGLVLLEGTAVIGIYNAVLAPVVFWLLARISTRLAGDPLASV